MSTRVTKVKIVAVADTHDAHRRLVIPDGDIFIHAGDLTMLGGRKKLKDVFDWIAALPHKHKIVIAGNHDLDLDQATPMYHDLKIKELVESYPTIHYLCDSAVDIAVDGQNLKIWGSPFSPAFQDWAFQYKQGERLWQDIPEDTDIIVTHTPPKKILDTIERKDGSILSGGCEALANRVHHLQPLLHVFGHLHDDGGQQVKIGDTRYVNAAVGYEDEWFEDEIPKPVEIELFLD